MTAPAGIVVATGFEPSYNATGFSAALGATAARALKAVIQVHDVPGYAEQH